jgi:hypothetical protein
MLKHEKNTIATEHIDIVLDQVSCMSSKSFGKYPDGLYGGPHMCVCIEHMQVLKMLGTRMSAKEV